MKRILISLSCIISIFWFMPLLVHASYTAPDGNDYEYMLTTAGGSDNTSYYCTMYSNDKFCFCDEFKESFHGSYRYTPIGLYRNGDTVVAARINSNSGSYAGSFTNSGSYPSGYSLGLNNNVQVFYQDSLSTTTGSWYAITSNNPGIQIFSTMEDCYEYLTTPEVDFETIYYDPTIPLPNFKVTLERPVPWESIVGDTNFFDITFSLYNGYYAQVGYKYATPSSMKVSLVDGNVVYTPLEYNYSIYYDVDGYSLSEMADAGYLNNISSQVDFSLVSDPISEQSEWTTSVPIWANNYNNSKYVSARNNWNNKLRYCFPLYGNKLEIFVRLFYVSEGSVYVGAWNHWNNSYPSEYQEELPSNYQMGNEIPGVQNTNNSTDYQDQEITETVIGNQTGQDNNPTVIVNNLTPNYPDYPTIATYNHDNLLLQFFTTAKQLPSLFNGFTNFLSVSFAWIPSYIWDIIAFGFLASITVMILKIL